MSLLRRLKQMLLPYEDASHPLYIAKPEEPGDEWDDLRQAPFQIKYTTSSDPDNTSYLIPNEQTLASGGSCRRHHSSPIDD